MADTITASLEEKKILVIDDEEFTGAPAISFLDSRGAAIKFADSLEKGLTLLEKIDAEERFDLVVIDLLFTNGIPAKLKKHIDRPDKDRAFQGHGAAMGKWLRENRSLLPFIYYAILPNRTDDPEITVDKLKKGPLELLEKVQERLPAQKGEDNVAISTVFSAN